MTSETLITQPSIPTDVLENESKLADFFEQVVGRDTTRIGSNPILYADPITQRHWEMMQTEAIRKFGRQV